MGTKRAPCGLAANEKKMPEGTHKPVLAEVAHDTVLRPMNLHAQNDFR